MLGLSAEHTRKCWIIENSIFCCRLSSAVLGHRTNRVKVNVVDQQKQDLWAISWKSFIQSDRVISTTPSVTICLSDKNQTGRIGNLGEAVGLQTLIYDSSTQHKMIFTVLHCTLQECPALHCTALHCTADVHP
jgi:hypothetical protein